MFYSYYVAKGYEYRKICAPKRRACDGYFGCYDESTIERKEAGQELQRITAHKGNKMQCNVLHFNPIISEDKSL